MYSYIKGLITLKDDFCVVIEASGIGYLIKVPSPEEYSLNENTIIYLHQIVKEDDISLYGFKSIEQKNLFVKLINVKGLGPRGALSILKANASDIVKAINDDNSSFFKQFAGIGPKLSSQIILDLKGKLVLPKINELEQKVFQALKSLGFSASEAKSITERLDYTENDLNSLIKKALQIANKL